MMFRRSCKEVTRLVLVGNERPLRFEERVALRFHWMACQNCTRFKAQAHMMRAAVDRWRTYREE